MSESDARYKLADLIQQVLEGTLQPEAALKITKTWENWPRKDRELDDAWHALTHFQIDEDIRARDPKYDASMRQALRNYIAKLRATK